jgi:hypothetical protein
MKHCGTSAHSDFDRVIATARLHNDDLVNPVDHGRNAARDPMGLVLGDDKARYRQFAVGP